jgi:DNA-directed RNA polymerase subunit RPC12/RpoP
MMSLNSLLGKNEPETRTYWGKISAQGLAQALVGHFDTAETRAQMVGDENRILVQIANRQVQAGDPSTALTVGIVQDEDSVTVTVGQQRWLGIAADLAKTGLLALINPWTLVQELDDVARNVDWLGLRQQLWDVIGQYCQSAGGSLGLPPDLRQVACPYCGVGNPIGQPKCSACGAPLGDYQPVTCPQCGYLLPYNKRFCTRCGASLKGDKPAYPQRKRSTLI